MTTYDGPPLSRGALRAMVCGAAADLQPVLQVVDVKPIGSFFGAPTERFRLILSDGEHYQQAMLATQLNDLIKDGEVDRLNVVRMDECVRGAAERSRVGPHLRPCAIRAPHCVLRCGASRAPTAPQVLVQHGADPQVRA